MCTMAHSMGRSVWGGGGTHMCTMGRSVCVWGGGARTCVLWVGVCVWGGGVHAHVYGCARCMRVSVGWGGGARTCVHVCAQSACLYVFVEHRVYS